MRPPENTPILVAAVAVEQQLDDHLQAREAIELMIDAVQRAAEEAGCAALPSLAQRISVPKGMWSYSDPGRLIADAVGADQATTVLAEIGILQQSLIGDACQRIAEGEIEVVVVAGGEHRYRWLRAQIAGVEAQETLQTTVPDHFLKPEEELWSTHEVMAGLAMPVGFYAIMESSLRAADGLDLERHRDSVAAMYQRFSEIAATNPHAWKPQAVPAQQIRNAAPKNPMLAFPYTKLHNTSWNVDQAAALIFTSVAKARELGIDQQHWIYPQASTESNYIQAVSSREQLHGCPGAGLSAQAAYEAADIGPADVTHWELYSCFPIAVSSYAREAGVPAGVDMTVTGGMPFAGGPLNNFVLQSTVRMIEKLRQQPGIGMVSSVSGLLTKQAWGLWSNEFAAPYRFVDVTEQVRQGHPTVEVIGEYEGAGRIIGYTVAHVKGQAERIIAVIELPDGRRSVCFNQDPELMQACMAEEFVGREVVVQGGQFSI